MNTQIDGGGVELPPDALKESLFRIKMPEAQSSIAPRVRKSASAQLAVQRTEAWRQERIATAAYYLAQKRGFEPGHEQEDWLLAEAQVDAGDAAI
ncbi:MAG: DUF2934 domain-containing protein [Steroidobacteraceae bacterium]|jgi:hypothetical protein